jgi:hypothetical protein
MANSSSSLSFWLCIQGTSDVPLWNIIKQVFGWEGFSFVVLFGFALVFLEMKKLRVARCLFVVSAAALIAKLMSSSETYLPSDWVVHGKWASILISAFFLTGMLYWVSVEAKKTKPPTPETGNGINLKQRDFLVERLTDFTREADRSWESSGKFREFAMQTRFLEIGLSNKIKKFLEIHLPNEVERFKGKGIDGVEEIIADLLNGSQSKARVFESVEAKNERHISLKELEEQFEVKKLEPNFVDIGNEYVEVYDDDKGVIVRGSSPDKERFHAMVGSFGNEHPRNKVRSLQRVSFKLNFICFDRATRRKATGINIHRGAWLTEAEIEIDFPAHCPPRRAVIVTAEGADNRVYAVRRDSDSSYKSILPFREELTGSVYTVFVTLLVESRNSKNFQYILEIIREPDFALRLTNAAIWKSEHLYKFVREGIGFSDRLHEIWKDVNDRFPFPPSKTVTNFLRFDATEPFDYAKNTALIRAAEKEQEEKMLEEIKDWEARAVDWVDLFIGAEQRDKLSKSVPSIEAGFNRVQKSRFGLRMPSLEGKPAPPPPLPYWQLRDAVSSRTDVLMKIAQQL